MKTKDFSIQNSDNHICFHLHYPGEGLDFKAIIKYEYPWRAITLEHDWGIGMEQLQAFLEELTSMQNSLTGKANLSSFEGDSIVLSIIDELGHIDVEIKDGLWDSDAYLQICFRIDQSYLPDIIKQMETLCTSN